MNNNQPRDSCIDVLSEEEAIDALSNDYYDYDQEEEEVEEEEGEDDDFYDEKNVDYIMMKTDS